MDKQKDLELILRSRMPIVVIDTRDESRMLNLLKDITFAKAGEDYLPLFRWSITDGLQRLDIALEPQDLTSVLARNEFGDHGNELEGIDLEHACNGEGGQDIADVMRTDDRQHCGGTLAGVLDLELCAFGPEGTHVARANVGVAMNREGHDAAGEGVRHTQNPSVVGVGDEHAVWRETFEDLSFGFGDVAC